MTIHTFIEQPPDGYGPTQADIPYSDLDGDTLFELAMQGDNGAVEYMNRIEDPDDEAVTKADDSPKVEGPHEWPGWQWDEATAEFYAPKIELALAHSVSGTADAIAATRLAYQHLPLTQKAPTNGPDAVTGQISAQAVNSNVAVNQTDLEAIYAELYGDAYLIGTHAAANVMGPKGPGAILFLAGLDRETDWDTWKPGNPRAALRLADGGLKQMLEAAGQRIKDVDDTTLDGLARVIGQGVAAGDSNQVIQQAVAEFIRNPVRADMIARTEVARAVTRATEDTYAQAGVTEWNWLIAPNACPICIRNGAGGPYPLGGGPYMPAHPRCRCVKLPVINF